MRTTIYQTPPLQVNSFPLDVDTLCDFSNEESQGSIDIALGEWERVNSPITYWYNRVDRYLRYDSPLYDPMEVYEDPSDFYKFSYGLPAFNEFHDGLSLNHAEEMCKTLYKQDIAKVTLEILDSQVLRIKKDVKTTFASQLGVFGKKCQHS